MDIDKTNITALGEGLLWDERVNKLFYVDILEKKLVVKDFVNATSCIYTFDEEVCWIQKTKKLDVYAVGLGGGIYLWDISKKLILQQLYRVASKKLRLNDSYVDSEGRLWFGTMNKQSDIYSIDGSLFCMKNELVLNIDIGYSVTNGPVQCGKKMLHSDSLRGITYAYFFDDIQAGVSRKIWRQFDINIDGLPDGMCVDSSGDVWIAMWGTGIVCRLNSDGDLIEKKKFPTNFVSNVCFCGESLDKLYVTSATPLGVSEKDDAAGALFSATIPNVQGVLSNIWNVDV